MERIWIMADFGGYSHLRIGPQKNPSNVERPTRLLHGVFLERPCFLPLSPGRDSVKDTGDQQNRPHGRFATLASLLCLFDYAYHSPSDSLDARPSAKGAIDVRIRRHARFGLESRPLPLPAAQPRDSASHLVRDRLGQTRVEREPSSLVSCLLALASVVSMLPKTVEGMRQLYSRMLELCQFCGRDMIYYTIPSCLLVSDSISMEYFRFSL